MKNKTLLNVLLCGMLSCAFVNSSLAETWGEKERPYMEDNKHLTNYQIDVFRKNTVTDQESKNKGKVASNASTDVAIKQEEKKQFVDVYEFCRTVTWTEIEARVEKAKQYLNTYKGDVHEYIERIANWHIDETFEADGATLQELFDIIAWTEEYAFNNSPKEFYSKNVDFDTLNDTVYDVLDQWWSVLYDENDESAYKDISEYLESLLNDLNN